MKAKKALALSLSALMLAGCGGSNKVTYDTTTYRDYIVMGQDFTTLNYLYSWAAVDFRVIANLVDGLVENDPYGRIIPCLAESWEHNDDYTVWTFHLREDAKWYKQDGTEYAPVTADDFVYGVEYILDPVNESYNTEMVCLLKGASAYLAAKDEGKDADMSTVGVKALDDHTVEYTMESGAPYFLSACLYASFFPANREYVESIPDTIESVGTKLFGSKPELLLYNGAYIIDEYVADNHKTYKRNEDYWDKEHVPFETVEILAVKDKETVKEYFERGETSYCPLTSVQVETLVRNDSENLVQLPLESSVRQVMLNCEITYSDDAKAAVNNENFRKAMYYATDQDMYNEISVPLNVEAVRANGWTAPDFIYTSDGRDYATLGTLGEQRGYIYDKDKALEYKEAAKAELEAAGVTFPVTLKYYSLSGNEVAANQARILKEIYESNLGTDFITIELGEYATSSEYTAIRQAGNYGMATGAWGPDYADPINMLTPLTTTGNFNNIDTDYGSTHWNYPEFDAMIAAANAEVKDVDKRYEMFAEAEAFIYEHAYLIPLYTYGGEFQLTTINNYSKPYSKSGICNYKLKYIQAFDHVLTTEENDALKAEWEAKRKELGIGA